jgi:LPXTG-site transpeptidase (sortase) family protein
MVPDPRIRKFVVAGCVLALGLAVTVWLGGAWIGNDPGTRESWAAVDEPTDPSPTPEEVLRQRLPSQRPSPLKPKPKPSAPPTVEATPQPATNGDVLQLPALQVSAPIQMLPVTESLTLDPPSDYTTVGLWPRSAQPGDDQGTAIIAGHTVHTGGGALDDLEESSPGDQIVVERPGEDLIYRVESVTTYRKATLGEDAASIFSQTVPGRLAVVTCEDWNGSVYLSNVVVIAVPA